MIKVFTLLSAVCLFMNFAHGQKKTGVGLPGFGKVDMADLELKNCEFESDANAMVLFDKGDVYYDNDLNINLVRHKRIKIFNDKGKKQADIRLETYGGRGYQYITGLQAQVYNLINGKVEVTKIDKKQIFTEEVDKSRSALIFSFPNVKAGSVVEYKYMLTTVSLSDMSDWYFQEEIPIRHSELITAIPEWFRFNVQQRSLQPFSGYKTGVESRTIGSSTSSAPLMFNENKTQYIMTNVASMVKEPYMRSEIDNLQCVYFSLSNFNPPMGFTQSFSDSWDKVSGTLANDEDFGLQFKRKLAGEDLILAKAKALKTDAEKIAYLFNEVKNSMKWNNSDRWYTIDGTAKAWEKKTGNSAEVNLILYHLLKQAGVSAAVPMVVSTRSHGRVNPYYSSLYQFNRAVVYIPVDSTRNYVLDATSKYNSYLEVPDNLLNSHGFWIDKDKKESKLIFLTCKQPVKQTILLNAEIMPEGTMNGTAQIYNYSYNRLASIENYKSNGEKKYIDYLRSNDNALNISSIKVDNMDVDSLPLTQNVGFKLELTGSDKDYIYFRPNLFTSFKSNPFLSENRYSDIDFGHNNNYNITGIFKLPAGYKSDALPKNITLVMPDKSITCRRMIAEEGGSIMVRYLIIYDKSSYPKENYPELREFYKKMYEMLDEKVVLKKA
jgi:hypothetical protein